MPYILSLMVSMLLLINACCPMTSVHPLGEPSNSDCDPRLAGVWRHDADRDFVMLHIGKAKTGRIQIIAVEHNQGGKVDYDGFTVSGIHLKNQYYLDIDTALLTPEHREGEQGHVIVTYRLPDDDTLTFSMLELDAVAAAIQAKKLAGEITYRKPSTPEKTSTPVSGHPKVECARITDTSDNLVKFISESDPGRLFKPVMTFKRVSH